jgi:hypothetical protein
VLRLTLLLNASRYVAFDKLRLTTNLSQQRLFACQPEPVEGHRLGQRPRSVLNLSYTPLNVFFLS